MATATATAAVYLPWPVRTARRLARWGLYWFAAKLVEGQTIRMKVGSRPVKTVGYIRQTNCDCVDRCGFRHFSLGDI
jgi:hypothetical protein